MSAPVTSTHSTSRCAWAQVLLSAIPPTVASACDYCVIVLLLHAVLNVAITGEAYSLMVNSAG